MKKTAIFFALAGGGVALLAWAGGGFFGAGPRGERPRVQADERSEEGAGGGIDLAPFAGATRHPIPGRLSDTDKTGSVGARETAPSVWEDPRTRERFEFPRFLLWTFSASELEPFRDAVTGEQGFRYRDVRIAFYRPPETRAEAEALRDDPVGGRLLRIEVEAEEGWAAFAAQVGKRPDKPLVRLPRSARLRDHLRDLTVVCDDATVDLDAGTAEGAGEIFAEHPACSLRGRGMRIDSRGSRFEILRAADVRLRDAGVARARKGAVGVEGEMRPSRVRGTGGAVLAPLPAAEGKGYRVVIERGVQIEQEGGPSLEADAAEIVVRPDEAREGGRREGSYALRSFVAEGHVRMDRRGAEAEDQPSLLSVFCDRLVHEPGAGGTGRTHLEGDCQATYRGAFSPSGGSATRGIVRVSCRRLLSIGPAGEDHPEADLRLALEGDAVVERTEAAGDEAPERLEAPRIDLFLRRSAAAAGASAASPLGGQYVAVGFVASGGVRLDGPRLSGVATTLSGRDLERPEFRLVAEGPDADFDVASAGRRGGGRLAARTEGQGSETPPAKRERSEKDGRGFEVATLRAEGDVEGSIGLGGGAPLHVEGESLAYDRTTGAVLRGKEGREAWMAMGAGSAREERVAAPRIAFRVTDGVLETTGPTVATVWLGGTREPSASAPADRVRVRGGARIAIDGQRAAGTQVLVRIEGGGVVETRNESGVVERLRARGIEIAIGQTGAGSPPSLFGPQTRGPGTRTARPAAAGSPPGGETTARAAPKGEATRWTLRSRGLEVRLGGAGGEAGFDTLRSFVAVGGVVARTEQHVVEGERLSYDGESGIAVVTAPASRPAALRLGADEDAQRAWAREIEVALVDGRPTRALLRRPATVVLFRRAPKGTGTERFQLRTDGDLEITPRGASVRGRTAVTRSERGKPGEPYAKPSTLWTPDLTIEAERLLGGGKAELRRLLARGAGTRFEAGDPNADGLAAIGDSIVYDAKAEVVTIRDSRRALLVQGGKRVETKSIVYDVKTGLPDFEGPRVILKRE